MLEASDPDTECINEDQLIYYNQTVSQVKLNQFAVFCTHKIDKALMILWTRF